MAAHARDARRPRRVRLGPVVALLATSCTMTTASGHAVSSSSDAASPSPMISSEMAPVVVMPPADTFRVPTMAEPPPAAPAPPPRTASAAPPPAPAKPAPTGKLLWAADEASFDPSRGRWAGFEPAPWEFAPEAATPVPSPGRDGTAIRTPIGPPNGPNGSYVATAPGHQGSPLENPRCELRPAIGRFQAGDEAWFGFSVYFERLPATGDWQTITQFRQQDGPAIELALQRGGRDLIVQGGWNHPDGPRYTGNDDRGVTFSRPILTVQPGRWYDVVLHLRFSPNPGTALFEAWVDGESKVAALHPPGGTINPTHNAAGQQVLRADSVELKYGYYRSGRITQPGAVLFTGWRIGTTMDVVS